MQPLSLTPKDYWAVSKAKPDNMVLAATSWPGKTLCCWKICFSFPLLLQALTQKTKGWSSFAGLNQALRREREKWGKWMIPCTVPSNSMTLSVSSDSRLQDPWILPHFRYGIHPNSSQHLPFKSHLLSMASLTHLCHKQCLMWVVCHPSWQTNLAMAALLLFQARCKNKPMLEMTHPPLLPPLPTFSAALGSQTSARLLETTLTRWDSPLPSSVRHTPQALGKHPSATAGAHW